MSLILSATSSLVSWTFSTATYILVGGVVFAVVSFATKPSFASFESSFEAMRKLENSTTKPVKRHVTDMVLFLAVQSDMDVQVEEKVVKNVERIEERTTVITSIGFFGNWYHSNEYWSRSSTEHVKVG